MLNTQPMENVIPAMHKQNVYIGRVWPAMPTWVRVTVGTPEMGQFQTAFNRVMKNTVAGKTISPPPKTSKIQGLHPSGFRFA